MIISHKHKYIFLRSRKTASSSLCAVLNKTLGPADIQVGGWADALTNGGSINRYMYMRLAANPRLLIRQLRRGGLSRGWPPFSPGLVNRISKADFLRRSGFRGEHPLAIDVKIFCNSYWDRYHKFTVVRNPWDHAVSDYHWRTAGAPHVSFVEFLRRLADPSRDDAEGVVPPIRSNWPIYTLNGSIVADSIVRYEDLSEELPLLGKRLGVSVDLTGVNQKANYRKKVDLKRYYDEECINLVEEIYREEIDAFGYKIPF